VTAHASFAGEVVERSLFSVPDAHCAGCLAKIERGLSEVPGVVSARMNLTARQVAILHSGDVQIPQLMAALETLGFAAQPLNGPLDGQEKSASRALLRATAVAGFAAMNIMLLSVSVWSGAGGATRELFHLISGLIALPTISYSGRTFFRSAWGAVRRRRTNMDVPISIGVLLVTGLSLFEALTGGAHVYFDGAVMLIFFLLVGRVLDSIMRDRARDGVTALLKQSASGALVLDENGSSHWVRTEALQPGMRISVAAGERLAADGVIESGSTSLDMSLLTGESAPHVAAIGDTVHAGTLNFGAPIEVRVTAVGQDTSLAEIARLMVEAGQGRSRYVRIADRAARLYAPAVHALAATAFITWLLLGAGWHQALLVSAAVLIITCPCALGLAVPAAQIVTAGSLLRAGVLVKDGTALERLAEADLALFDKTGTLTLGRPELVNGASIPDAAKPIILALARSSRHPLAEATRRSLEREGAVSASLVGVAEEAGFGVRGHSSFGHVSLGRGAHSGVLSTSFEWPLGPAVELRFEDRLRPDAAEAIRRLRSMGIDCSIVSGDSAASVATATRGLMMTAAAVMTPQDKLDLVGRLHRAGHKVLMVGDGLNDGPALAAGYVSMAPGSASDVGQNASDAVFLGDSLLPVAKAVSAARRTMRIVRQNFTIAIAYNVCAVPLAFAGKVTPLVAAIAMSLSSIAVVGNALRLRSAAR
jgi:Cu2+-exporting ATPase